MTLCVLQSNKDYHINEKSENFKYKADFSFPNKILKGQRSNVVYEFPCENIE